MLENVLKVLALPALGAVAGVVWVSGWGPYGVTRAMPKCAADKVCVVVAGLDGDVRYVPQSGEAAVVDLSDESATRLVRWLQSAHPDGAEVVVRKYPRRLSMGEPGTEREQSVQANSLARALRLSERFGADLMVIGEVDGDDYRIAFINPVAPPELLTLADYPVTGSGPPRQLAQAYAQALEAPLASLRATAAPVETPPQERPRERSRPPAEAPPSQAAPPPRVEAAPPPRGEAQPPRAPSDTGRQGGPAPPVDQQVYVPPAPPPPPPPLGPVTIGSYEYLQRPTANDVLRFFPQRALERGRSGVASVECTVLAGGRVSCAVSGEDPPGWGFGEAAVRAAEYGYRIRDIAADGRSTVGARFSTRFQFNAEGG